MQLDPFDHAVDLIVLGLSARVVPGAEAREIPALWQRFLSSPHDPSRDVYAIYCDYERDFRGPYTMVIGQPASPSADVPPDRRRVRIPFGPYARTHAEGHPAQALWQAWTFINTSWPDRTRRRYIADYERYAPGAIT